MENILLPALNEAASIGDVIDEIRKYCPLSEITVVDSKSTDKTRDVAIDKRVTLLIAPRGKGAAVRYAFGKLDANYEKIVMLDSDGTYPAVYIPFLFKILDHYDVVVGYRNRKEKGSMSFLNVVGNFGLSLLASILYGYRMRDVCSGMWGFRKESLEKFNLVSNGFTLEADLFVNSIANKCIIFQTPIHYMKRSGGSPKLKIWDGFKIAWFLVKERFK